MTADNASVWRKCVSALRNWLGGAESASAAEPPHRPERHPWGIANGWLDVSLAAERHELRLGGGDPANGGNPARYALRRWGGRLPRTGVRALVLGGAGEDDALALEWLAALPEVGEITLVGGGVPDAEPHPEKRIVTAGWEDFSRSDGCYHVAIGYNSLARMGDIEDRLGSLDRALAAGGVLVVRDYVGPSRFQFTTRQLDVVNALLALLPEERRRDIFGLTKRLQTPPPLEWLLRNDPSAALRSGDLRGMVAGRFRVLEEIFLGGTILMPLMAGIAHNFQDDSAECRRLVGAALELEDALVGAGLLPSDHWCAVASRPARFREPVAGEGVFIERKGGDK